MEHNGPMDESRYGKAPRRRILALGLPIAVLLFVGGAYVALLSWGLFGGEESKSLSVLGPLCAGLGVALGVVCVRPPQ